MKYSEKLKDPRWQKKRLKILERDDWGCNLCGDTETMLQVHHKEYTEDDPWNEPNKNLITLCKHCHNEITKTKIKDVNSVTVYKSVNWKNGNYIMFMSHEDKFSMSMHDCDENQIDGYNFTAYDKDELKHIRRLINKTLKNA